MILVTGAAGFVGAALCRELRARGMQVTAAVRRATDPQQLAVGDMTADTDWSAALAGCEAVIHLAARVHMMRDEAQDKLAAYRATNLDATLNLARQAARRGVQRFVFVSSIKVNGELTEGKPFTAHDTPQASDPYGISKLESELALQELSRQTGMEVTIVRPPLVYGAGVRANFLRLMQLVKLGVPLPFGNVSNRRSMVALDNLVDLVIVCAGHPAAAGQTFLASDGRDLSITELINLIAQAMDRRILLLPVPAGGMMRVARILGKGDVANRLLGSLEVDISHTRNTLGWQPVVAPEAGIKQAVAHFLGRR